MPVSDPEGTTVVELSRAEQWVVHHVLLDGLGLADGEERVAEAGDGDGPTLSAIEKLEAGRFEFTTPELRVIHRSCGEHAAATAAPADRNLASAVADRIEPMVEAAPD